MKKINLLFVGLALAFFGAKAQDTTYTKKKLSFEEANLVSSFYHQEGNHAAVTGGTGTQKLTDIANIVDVKFLKLTPQGNKHHLGLEVGVDMYSSASSDKVDLQANSSASHSDTRYYPTLTYQYENTNKNYNLGGNASFSTEFDYTSLGLGAEFGKGFNDNNTEISLKGKAYLDQVSLIYPIELRTGNNPGNHNEHYGTAPRNSYSGSLSLSQVVNDRLSVMAIAEVIQQNGFLSLPFHRVYTVDGKVRMEALPANRLKVPLGLRANYFAGDKFIIRTFYRYYSDSWDIKANTADLELVYKISPFFSLSPFYRYYQQSASKYFAPYMVHTAAEEYVTSNYDQSKFNSNFFGAGVRLAPPEGVFKLKHIGALELRYGHYQRSDGLNSNIVSMMIKVK